MLRNALTSCLRLCFMDKSKVDYSVYLVTGRNLLPPGKDYLESLEESLQGGVTIVQIREKDTETQQFLEVALASKAICDRYSVPLIINDRIDIALAVNASGVHLGQTDMPIDVARRLLPPTAIIGLSCNTVDHIKTAVHAGVDYVGIGAVWSTTTKSLTQPVIGVRGVGPMLEALDGTSIKAVAIGGIKTSNLLRTLHGAVSRTGHPLDGIAIISEIVASTEPGIISERLSGLFRSFMKSFVTVPQPIGVQRPNDLVLNEVVQLFDLVRQTCPLIHQITNSVVSTQSANITLALGASPIMASSPKEMEDLARIPGALLVNIGTLVDDTKQGMLNAGYYANLVKKPIVLDPVGVGASAYRKETVDELLNTWQASVIKGNAGELAALAGSVEVQSKGVDSVGKGFSDPAAFVQALALKERCVIALTGETDYISDGKVVVVLKNGNDMLGKLTGAGCIAGSCIASFCAAASSSAPSIEEGLLIKGKMLHAAIGGILALTIAAELAVKRSDVRGTGTFLPALIDELGGLLPDTIRKLAKLEIVTN